MFYLFRMIVFFVLNTLYFVIVGIVLQDQAKKSVLTKKRYNLIKIIGIACVLVVTGISFIPFEAPFVRFDTPQEALKYRWIDTEDTVVCESDYGAFIVKPDNEEIFSVAKDEKGYGYLNYHSKKELYIYPHYNQFNTTGDFIYSCNNQSTNETIYLVYFYKKIDDNINIDLYKIICDDVEMERIPYITTFGSLDEFCYYIIDENPPKESIGISINGEKPMNYSINRFGKGYYVAD